MEEWLTQAAAHAPYIAILGTLLLSGFGLPLPEDLPLIIAGYLCGVGLANPWLLFPGCFLAIVGADAMVFVLGRLCGHHIPRLPLLRRFLTEKHLARTEGMLHRHGGKFIFMARFLPGLRTAAFFTAGSFKLPYWKFLIFDGSAALISVPLILGLAYAFADQIDTVKNWIAEGQIYAVAGLVVLVVLLVIGKRLLKRRMGMTPEAPQAAPPPRPADRSIPRRSRSARPKTADDLAGS